jgi:ubiquitin carboxyl-terminal hydrolase 36/42
VDPVLETRIRFNKKMLIFEILGLQGFVYLFLLLGFVVIRYVWKNAETKKEEVMMLVQDTAAEMEAYADSPSYEVSATYDDSNLNSISNSNSVPVSELYQCAVCYSPTTMRCSRCKAVRYWFVFCFLSQSLFF